MRRAAAREICWPGRGVQERAPLGVGQVARSPVTIVCGQMPLEV
jgi:hypothetical protein